MVVGGRRRASSAGAALNCLTMRLPKSRARDTKDVGSDPSALGWDSSALRTSISAVDQRLRERREEMRQAELARLRAATLERQQKRRAEAQLRRQLFAVRRKSAARCLQKAARLA